MGHRATHDAQQQGTGPLDPTTRRLLNDYQHDLPLSPTPFADIAAQIGVDEATVLEGLQGLQESGAISRVGPVLQPRRVGASTLAAVAVPPERLEEVAELVNGYTEVNHNYEREHRFNLWFVATAPDEEKLAAVLADIERRTGLQVLDLPMIEDYHIDLGFPLQW
ncbi:MAG TPA: Lrp/AsnC family transcriptional regulator [Gammaproteobacteria bacterium]|nr:Lrp/AsnC family transcriptional regulator [Gammaproteobacteria bacterium]